MAFPIDNPNSVPKVAVETDLDGTEEIVVVFADGSQKTCTLAVLAELVEDLLA